jgi:hypothetical protein
MRCRSCIASGVITIVAALAAIWACETKPPTEPTPPAVCTFTLSRSALTFGASGGSASVTVTTTAGCAWTAASDRGWVSVGSGAGTGSGTVAVSVTANANPEARSGTLTIAGQPVAVTQAGTEACTIAISPASAAFSKDAATATLTVTAGASCAWTAVSTVEWLTVASPADGRGSGSVSYNVARNTDTAGRTGAIRVGDATLAVTQAGDSGSCEYQVAPVVINACMSVPYDLTAMVATQAACGWTAASDTSWVTMSGVASRVGPGEVRLRIADNYDAPREGMLKLRWDTPTAGQNVRVLQAGCRYAVSTNGLTVPADGGMFDFEVYQQSDPLECGGPLQNGCVWTAAADAAWITITTSMPRAGDDRVSFNVSSNADGMRSARITVRDKIVTVVQAAR